MKLGKITLVRDDPGFWWHVRWMTQQVNWLWLMFFLAAMAAYAYIWYLNITV